jgi:uncharacterized protein (DUF58 family)
VKPTRRSILVLAAGLAVALLPALGLTKSWPAIVTFWGVMALVLAVDALRSPSRHLLSRRLIAPQALHVGANESLALELSTRASRPLEVEAVIGVSPDLGRPSPLEARVGAEPVRIEWTVVPSRRGVAHIDRMWIRYTSPWKLWATWIDEPLDRELPVLPDVPQVRSAAIRFFDDRHFRAGLKIERYRGDGSEFDSLKEFLPGDDHRTMDWKSSARHRRLLCRQHRAERNHQVVLAIDTGRLMSEMLGSTSRLDLALNAALLLAYVCLKSGDRVGMFTFDARAGASLEPMHGVGAMRNLVYAVARARYSHDETNFTLGLTTLAQRLRRRSLVILFTDFSDTVTAGLMLERLQRIARDHVLVFVSIRDPVMAAIAAGAPGDLEGLGRAVVAADLLRDRERVHLNLRRMGVAALDVAPERIAPELINQYLDIKRRERV